MMVDIPKPNPRCCICGNAYGTRFVCSSCKDDPANADWSEGDEASGDVEMQSTEDETVPWGEGPVWQPTPLFSQVAQLLKDGMSTRAIAAEAGCSQAYVQKVAEAVGLGGPKAPVKPGRHVLEIYARNTGRPQSWVRDTLSRLHGSAYLAS